MRILMVTPYLPYPPASGGQIRTLNLLKYLSRSHEIVLVALSKNDADSKYLKEIEKYCTEIHICQKPKKPWQISNILKSVFTYQPFLIVRNYSREASETITQLLKNQKFDVIHTETFYVMPHVPKTSTPIVLVEQTIEFQVYKHFVDSLSVFIRLPLYLDILKLRYWEKYYWKRASLIATVSEQDRRIVRSELPDSDPVVVPNGAGEDMMMPKLTTKKIDKPRILFQGNFSWLQNVEAAQFLIDKIVPKVRAQFPNIEFVIAGQHASKIRAANGITVIDIAYDDADTVKRLYRDSTIFLAPIFGPGGTRLKILAAMSCGLPIISTTTGIEGLEVKDGTHILIANKPKEFTLAIERLLTDHVLYERLRVQAHALIHSTYNWKSIARRLEAAYETIQRT